MAFVGCTYKCSWFWTSLHQRFLVLFKSSISFLSSLMHSINNGTILSYETVR
jgi:hypothetical protein